MKSLKKTLAVFLSVLMVVLSFPLSAFALYNPNNEGYAVGDEPYSTDYDVEWHMYAVPYTSYNNFLFVGNKAKYYDITNMTLDEVRADMDADATDGSTVGYYDDATTFAIIFTLENVDVMTVWQLAIDYDSDYIIPAYHSGDFTYYTTTGAQGSKVNLAQATTLLGKRDNYETTLQGFGDGGSTSSLKGTDTLTISQTTLTPGPSAESVEIKNGRKSATIPGSVLCVFGFTLLQDCDLTDVMKVQIQSNRTYVQANIKASNDYNIVLPGSHDYLGNELKNTRCTFPEFGLTSEEGFPAEGGGSENVTYTYHFANGDTQQVTAEAGKEPVAPANTANTAPVSNNDGTHTYNKYTWPAWVDGTTDYTEVATPVTDSCNMEEIEAAVDPIHADGQLVDGKTAVMQCKDCGYKTGGEVIPAGQHAYKLSEELSTPATCVAKGENVYVCSVCGDKMTEATEIDPSNHANVVKDEAVAATCTEAGLTEGSHCDACHTEIVAQKEIPALGHDFSVQVGESTATCITPGTTTYKCSRCDETKVVTGDVNPKNHEGEIISADNAVAPTRGEAGKEADKICSACHAVVEEGAVIPALGVQITVEQNDLGTTTLNGEATTGAAQKVAYEDNYTLTATPNEGVEFVGWQVNGKLVSTNATYTTAAYADLTYVPVFAEKTDDFTVTFVDQFNMVLGTYTSSQVADLEAMPSTYNYLGYTFADWNMTLEEVKALDSNAIVTASYTKDDALTYKVSAPGCTITVGDAEYSDTAEVGFDQAVTVAPAEGTATAWTVNGNDAAYGAEYTFYVTSDVNVAFTSDDVTAVPTVAGVDVTAVGDGNVRFLATRNVPAGYQLLESGFLYGKDYEDAAASLVLENANNTCYIVKNSNTAGDGQFALTFKITSETGVAYARAYAIVADAEGNAAVYYGNVQSFDYNA